MKKLKFVHITKTSGTYIENIAYEKGIPWGRFDPLPNYLVELSTSPWHIPYKYFNELELCNILDEYDLFTVVRNPYTRVISELFCKWGSAEIVLNVTEINCFRDKDNINSLLNKALKYLEKSAPKYNHWAKQSEFLFGKSGNVIINHVLKFENIEIEFMELMKKYKIDLLFDNTKFVNKNIYSFQPTDLSKANINLINKIYHDDFVNFDYDKM